MTLRRSLGTPRSCGIDVLFGTFACIEAAAQVILGAIVALRRRPGVPLSSSLLVLRDAFAEIIANAKNVLRM